tara:strand:+ start:774 stop:962 length:189 start_codon:yes stop_codon:yes gene_type:complete
LIERGDESLAGYLELTSGYWRRIEEAETARKPQIESMKEKLKSYKLKMQRKDKSENIVKEII